MLGYFATQKIESEIDAVLSNVLTYDEIDVDLITQNINLKNPVFDQGNQFVSAEGITIDGIGIYNYLINDKITIGEVVLNAPEIIISQSEPNTIEPAPSPFEQNIFVGSLQISNGSLTLKEQDTTLNNLFLKINSFELEDVAVNAETVENKIPFNFRSYALLADSLKLNMGELHYLTTGKISMENEAVLIEETRIVPKYNKVEFQQHIPYEKDRFELLVDSISFEGLTWEIENDTLQLKNQLLVIENADLEVYRNKLMPDDPRIKKMYSEQIRNIPFKVDFEEVEIKDSKIVYLEKAHEDRPPLKVTFEDVDGNISNIVNIGLKQEGFPETIVDVRATFMNAAPLEVDWNFNSSNLQERFNISGNLGALQAPALNMALKPGMNIEAKGKIESLAFNYSGNNDAATGDMRITYKDFEIIVLQKDGKKKNNFLSAILNIFVNKEGLTDDIVHENLQVARNKKRSFWNYLWLMVREGAIQAFI